MEKNNKGIVAGVAHEQAEKELGRSNMFFSKLLSKFRKREKKRPNCLFEADSE